MIDVHQLSYRYPGAAHDTLHDLSFAVAQGEIFGFLGPSGAGKSTTQRILTGLLAGYRGQATVFGAELHGHGRDFYERIGVSFEVPNVYGRLSGRENLNFFSALYRRPGVEPDVVLEQVGLGDAADQRVSEYSKGMRMRLNFARALLRRPELLFLDEPTTGQDPGNARRVKDLIREQRATGVTVFLTTHDMSVAAELCDRVGFLIDGRLALVDSPRALMVRFGSRTVRVEYETGDGGAAAEFALDGVGSDASFLELLRTHRITSIHSLDATLEEVFLAVTGRTLT